MSEDSKFESWAIVDLFGHTQLAGLVTEATIGGQGFVRIDVPSVNGRQAFTKFLGTGSIYSLTPCSEEVARLALERIMPIPISPYLLPETPALPRRRDRWTDDEEGQDREGD